MTVFFRVLTASVGDKPTALHTMVQTLAEGRRPSDCFDDDAESFGRIPGAPFSYWVPAEVRRLFFEGERFENGQRIARTTNNIEDNFRFVRLAWEVVEGDAWRRWAKGSTRKFYADIDYVVAWDSTKRTYRGFLGTLHRPMERPASVDLFELPGITWPLRARSFAPSALPEGTIFSVRSFMLAAPVADLPWLLGLSSSRVVDYLYKVLLGRFEFPEFVVTAMQRLPLPKVIPERVKQELAQLAIRAWNAERSLRSVVETSAAFVLPRVLRERQPGISPEDASTELVTVQRRIDELASALYGIDLFRLESLSQPEQEDAPTIGADQGLDVDLDDSGGSASDEASTLSWAVGVAFGRFDIGLATGTRSAPAAPSAPFAWRDWQAPAIDVGGHAIDVLAEDEGHSDDLVHRILEILDGASVERIDGIRAVLRHDFFGYHLQQYSRSSRRAPIYWQLATPSSSYSVWLYIHALTNDTIFRIQNDLAAPKLAHEERRLEAMKHELGERLSSGDRKQLAAQEALVEELRGFFDEVRRVAPLWKPNLDDGVVINAAPLWRLVAQHKPWQKELKATWDALCEGDYDWAHLSMHLWPERVVPKCATDRSLAIAHGLEEVFWVVGSDGKWTARKTPTRSLDELVRERTSPAVKAALKSLLEAPSAGGPGKKTKKGKADA